MALEQDKAIYELQDDVADLKERLERLEELHRNGLRGMAKLQNELDAISSSSLVQHPFNGSSGEDCGVCGYPEMHEGHAEFDDE